MGQCKKDVKQWQWSYVFLALTRRFGEPNTLAIGNDNWYQQTIWICQVDQNTHNFCMVCIWKYEPPRTESILFWWHEVDTWLSWACWCPGSLSHQGPNSISQKMCSHKDCQSHCHKMNGFLLNLTVMLLRGLPNFRVKKIRYKAWCFEILTHPCGWAKGCLNSLYEVWKRFRLVERLDTLRSRKNGRHFPDNILNYIFWNENQWILIKISLKFVLKGPINKIPGLVLQIMTWHRPGDNPLSEPIMVSLLTYMCHSASMS